MHLIITMIGTGRRDCREGALSVEPIGSRSVDQWAAVMVMVAVVQVEAVQKVDPVDQVEAVMVISTMQRWSARLHGRRADHFRRDDLRFACVQARRWVRHH